MNKVKLLLATTWLLTTSAVFAGDTGTNEILKKLQKEISALKEQVAKQESLHNEAITHYVKNEVDKAIKDRGTNLLRLGSNVENLKFTGDLRLRFQRNSDNDDSSSKTVKSNQESRDRFRVRFRLGFVWQTNENWEIGAGLATGGSDGRSTNETLNDGGVFETGDFRFDYAYAKHKFKGENLNHTITIGKMKTTHKTTKAFWDGDIRPSGIAYQFKTRDEGNKFFGNFGAYTLANLNSGRESTDLALYQAQLGIENSNLMVAVGYHHYGAQAQDVINTSGSFGSSFSADHNNDIEYRIADIVGEYKFATGDVKWKLFGQYAMNMGASDVTSQFNGITSDEDTAWVAGFGGKYGKMEFGYEYRYVEAHSIPVFVHDSDFGDGETNYQGHVLKVKYKFTKNMSLGVTGMLAKTIEDTSSLIAERDLLQLDLVYKF